MIAVIPARGGSKGLPRKNLKTLSGFPLIYYTIKAALESNEVSRVIVSTEDQEIADVALKYGAEVPFLRPVSLAQDDSMVMDSYFFTLDNLISCENLEIKSFVALLPTVPLRDGFDISKSVKCFRQKKADSVIRVPDAPVPIDWYMKVGENVKLIKCIKDYDAVGNRQERERYYIPNGGIYVFDYKF